MDTTSVDHHVTILSSYPVCKMMRLFTLLYTFSIQLFNQLSFCTHVTIANYHDIISLWHITLHRTKLHRPCSDIFYVNVFDLGIILFLLIKLWRILITHHEMIRSIHDLVPGFYGRVSFFNSGSCKVVHTRSDYRDYTSKSIHFIFMYIFICGILWCLTHNNTSISPVRHKASQCVTTRSRRLKYIWIYSVVVKHVTVCLT